MNNMLIKNTNKLAFKKFKQENHELKLELQTLTYNSVSTSEIPKTTLQYEWSTDKQGNLKELEQKATVGTLKIEAHYDAKKNITKIQKNVKRSDKDYDDDGEKENKETFE